MDIFGSSAVWGDAPSLSGSTSLQVGQPSAHSTPQKAFTDTSTTNPFDTFDDFNEAPPADSNISVDDDDFGDFGDFTENPGASMMDGGHDLDNAGFGLPEDMGFSTMGAYNKAPLGLNPLPDAEDLTEQIGNLLQGFVKGPEMERVFTREGIKPVENSTQLLVSQNSRSLYKTLFEEATPSLRAPNWTRSRIRRNHLITLGIPVNLDEVNPQANGRALPALTIVTRPSSAPPRPGSRQGGRSGAVSRAETPVQSVASARWATAKGVINNLGPKPDLDQEKIEGLLNTDPENLPLLPIPKLEAHRAALQSQTLAASNLLTYLLQSREALQQESDAFNQRIAELVNEAQRMKSGTRRQTSRKGGTMG
ncbi:hypothetical protein CPB86DRAFT_775753 [Serendipita vermifera]|nr:hypothetical protein CPB86DRAFT_775753 [Serendipita vermifera]